MNSASFGRGGDVNQAVCENYSILVRSPSSVLGEYMQLCW